MKNWIIPALAIGVLFLAVVGAGIFALAGMWFLASTPPPAPPPLSVPMSVPIPAAAPPALAVNAEFPPPPTKDGTQIERWEGYYYYSLESFEQAVANHTQRVRFWFETHRSVDGTFRAACNELSGGGDASVEGVMDRERGILKFDKRYTAANTAWQYLGVWIPERLRVEGTYGPNQGGFVLFPRRLTEEEIGRFENAGAPAEPPPPPKTPRKQEVRDAF